MAARKTKTTRKKTPSPAARQRAESAKFQRQSDLNTLQSAEEIRGDWTRMSGARTKAAAQTRALKRIAKK